MSLIHQTIKKAIFGKKIFQPFFEKIFKLSLEGMNIGTGGGKSADNGEAFAIAYALRDEKEPVVFDVGAQGGGYISVVLRVKEKAKIYAFEPRLQDYEILRKEFGEKIVLTRCAIGESDGEATLYYPQNTHGLSSLYQQDGSFSSEERVRIETIDGFCKRFEIKKITLLKLDVEGSEFSCLNGASGVFPHIRYIQFEMGIASRASKTYFKDIFDFLPDYRIYRILKDGLQEITTPDKISELLFTTNFLAERKI